MPDEGGLMRSRPAPPAFNRRAFLGGTVASGAMLALPGCRHSLSMDPGGWKNALGTTYTLPRWQSTPTSAVELATLVRRAEGSGRRIRMTGSGHSFSDVAVNADW